MQESWTVVASDLEGAGVPALKTAIAARSDEGASSHKEDHDSSADTANLRGPSDTEVGALPERHRQIVEASWALVASRLDELGRRMFIEIFRIAPEALLLFSFKGDSDLENSPALQLHGSLVMKTVGEAVAGLKDMPALVPVLKELARRHVDFNVKPEHFPIVGKALMTTLEAELGTHWTKEVRDAWAVVWETVIAVMSPELCENVSSAHGQTADSDVPNPSSAILSGGSDAPNAAQKTLVRTQTLVPSGVVVHCPFRVSPFVQHASNLCPVNAGPGDLVFCSPRLGIVWHALRPEVF